MMTINRILKLADFFYSLAKAEELPANSKDLNTILKNIERLETFNARKKYAKKNLKKLSSGSSRTAYLTAANTVIKLAKNDKGLAQNKAEANPLMKSKFVNKPLRKAKDFIWIEVDYLEKITEKDFKEMTGIDFGDFDECIRYGLKEVSDNSDKKPKCFDKVSKTEIYKELKSIGSKFKLMPGDLAKISSYGSKNGKPILIDAGLTKEVFDKHYSSSSSSSS